MPDTTHVHIVRASAGEYSDRREWTILAFTDEAAAQAEVSRLDAARNTFVQLCTGGLQWSGYYGPPRDADAAAAWTEFMGKPYEPNPHSTQPERGVHVDSDTLETTYWFETVELRGVDA